VIEISLGEVAEIVRGRLVDADPSTLVTGTVEFDSRTVTPGGLFLALRGERADGHDFVPAVIASGAVAAIVTRPVAAPSIEVADGFAALAALAAAVVRRLPDTTVIGVTGSSGKTSTKDLLAQLLARLGPTVAPPGSFNNELGHPYTVLRATAQTRYLVLENSARGIGHIRYLTDIAPPRIGVVLNVGSAHLGEFGSAAAIAQAKGELVEALPADGVAVLNADDPLVAAMAARTRARVVLVGQSPEASVRAEDLALDDLGRARFRLRAAEGSVEVALRLVGGHHVGNALAAAAVALECGMPLGDVAAALSAATTLSRWRMEVTERPDGVVVVNDAYNANPASMQAALEALVAIGARRGRRTVAVLGEMRELGPTAYDEHVGVGRAAAALGVDVVVVVGPEASGIADGAGGEAIVTAGRAEALAWVRENASGADVVLVKASRGAALETIAEGLLVEGDGTAP